MEMKNRMGRDKTMIVW